MSAGVVAILADMRARLDDPKKWTKGYYARDKDGRRTYSDKENAVCWCLLGAGSVASKYSSEQDRRQANSILLDVVLKGPGYGSIPGFNDDVTTKHSDVLAVLDRSLELARQ